MPQADLSRWVKAKEKPAHRKPERWAYRFLQDFPEGLMTPAGPVGPFRKGDLVSRNAMTPGMWAVLLGQGVVEPVSIR